MFLLKLPGKILHRFLLVCAFLFVCAIFPANSLGQSPTSPQKHALLIAIGDYPANSGFTKINSTNDLPLWRAALERQGFTENNITELVDAQATKKSILAAFDKLAREVSSGDWLLIHFSGHGQQVYDTNGDELDGYDEALVPYDAQQSYLPGRYTGTNHLIDDQLAQILQNLRAKLGSNGSCLFSIDACYSGTITRGGFNKSRGAAVPLQPAGYQPNVVSTAGLSLLFPLMVSADELAPMVVISASASHEKNFETRYQGQAVGPLSLALSRQLAQTDGSQSYRTMFARLREHMAQIAPGQHPQIEGNIDLAVFGGMSLPARPQISVVARPTENTVTIDAGLLAGLQPGAQLTLYSPQNDTVPLATGEIISADLLQAQVKLNRSFQPKDVIGKQLGINSFGRESAGVKVALQFFRPSPTTAALTKALEALPTVELTNTNPTLILTDSSYEAAVAQLAQRNAFSSFRLYDRHGVDLLRATKESSQIMQNGEAKAVEDLLLTTIGQVRAAQLFQQLEAIAPQQTTIQLVPVDYFYEKGGIKVKRQLPLNVVPGKGIVFKPGDVFVFRLKNEQPHKLYYNILQMDAAYETSVIIPKKDLPPSEHYLAPGEEKLIATSDYFFQMGEPLGAQHFKVVTSRRPFYLGDDLSQRRLHTSRTAESTPNTTAEGASVSQITVFVE